MTDTRGQSVKRQAEVRDTAVAPENAGKGGLPGEKRILKPGDNCVIRTISSSIGSSVWECVIL